MGPKHADAD
jgi:DUF971 family protein